MQSNPMYHVHVYYVVREDDNWYYLACDCGHTTAKPK